MAIGITREAAQGRALRTAAIGGLAFDLCYVVHRLLQGFGSDASTAAAIAAYNTEHRATLLGSEVAVGLALLAVVVFLAPLTPVIWRTGQETLAIAVLISGTAFIAMGFVSLAAETALVGVADSNQPGAVLALNELQGRTPIVWTIAALTATTSLAMLRTKLLPKWLGIAGMAAAGVFMLGSIFSVLGRTAEGNSSLIGVGLFILWMLALSVALWKAAAGASWRR